MNTFDWRNASPEQFNFWKLASAKLAYTTITPMFFEGAIAGSEFLTYDAAKLYIALEIQFGPAAIDATSNNVSFYDEANVLCYAFANNTILYNAANYFNGNSGLIKNIYFGRIITTDINYLIFNGYRLHT